MKRISLFAGICMLCLNVRSQTLPPNFFMSNVSAGSSWSKPVGAAFSKDGLKLFVWEQNGRVYVCNRNGTNYDKQGTPVIDLSAEVLNDRDFGLLGLALDPEFA